MKRFPLPKPSYANVVATLALFIALGGVAVAAGLPKNSVGPNQIKNGAVSAAKLKKAAVTAGKLAPKSVVAGKLGANAVLPGNLGNGVISTNKIAGGAVIASTIKNGAVTTNKLNNEAVTTAKLGKGSVTLAKLAEEVSPLLGTLKSGQTLRGVFDLGSGGETTKKGDIANGAVSFQFPLLNAPTVTVLESGQTSANCGGLGGGNSQTPAATGGNLCVYVTSSANAEAVTAENNTRLGFGLTAKAKEDGKAVSVVGQWAVTAP